MPRCEAVAKTPGRDNTGNRCRRRATTGSTHCVMHGGNEDTKTPEAVRHRKDRPANVCTAHRTDGTPCKAYAIRGGAVCRNHGGALPNVRKAAADRMLALLAPSVHQLQQIIDKPDTSDADRLRAITLVLDRTGLGPKSDLTVEVKKYEQVMDGIFKLMPAQPQADGAYSVTTALPASDPVLSPETTGDDWRLPEDDGVSTVEPIFLNDYRGTRGSAQPPRHHR